MTKKSTFEQFIAKSREVHGEAYQYPDQPWVGYRQKVRVVCPTHGEFLQSASNHSTKTGCPACAQSDKFTTQEDFLRRAQAAHPSYDFSRSIYEGVNMPVRVVCPNHGEFEVTASHAMTGRSGCHYCGRERTSAGTALSRAEWMSRFKAAHKTTYTYGEMWLDQEAWFHITCAEHGVFQQRAKAHAIGGECRKCANEKITGRPGETLTSFAGRAAVVHEGKYAYDLDESEGRYLTVICKDHGAFQQLAKDHADGHGCRSCASSGTSKSQQELEEFCRTLDGSLLTNHKFAGRKELDVYYPDRKLGIEYQGIYWHSTKFKDRLNIARKQRLAAASGIRIISVFEDEWVHNPDVVKATITHALGMSARVAARNCTLEVLMDTDEVGLFFNTHHPQGATRDMGALFGLRHQGELVMAMSMTKVNSIRGSVPDEGAAELRRLASSRAVVGGSSRLFKFAMAQMPEVKSVVSYSDNRAFSGGVYPMMGFSKDGVTRPDYYYVWRGHQVRYRKSNFTRAKLAKMKGFDPSVSEAVNTERMGLHRIYDSGKTRWRWTR